MIPFNSDFLKNQNGYCILFPPSLFMNFNTWNWNSFSRSKNYRQHRSEKNLELNVDRLIKFYTLQRQIWKLWMFIVKRIRTKWKHKIACSIYTFDVTSMRRSKWTRFCDAHSHWTHYLKLKCILANQMNELSRLNGPPVNVLYYNAQTRSFNSYY